MFSSIQPYSNFTPFSPVNWDDPIHENQGAPFLLSKEAIQKISPGQNLFNKLNIVGQSMGTCYDENSLLSQATIIGQLKKDNATHLLIRIPAHTLYQNGQLVHSNDTLSSNCLTFSHPKLNKPVPLTKILAAEKTTLEDWAIVLTAPTQALASVSTEMLKYQGPPIMLYRENDSLMCCVGTDLPPQTGSPISRIANYPSQPGLSGALLLGPRPAMHTATSRDQSTKTGIFLDELPLQFQTQEVWFNTPPEVPLNLPLCYETIAVEESLSSAEKELYKLLIPADPPFSTIMTQNENAFLKIGLDDLKEAIGKCIERLPSSGESRTEVLIENLKPTIKRPNESENTLRFGTRNGKSVILEWLGKKKGGALAHMIMSKSTLYNFKLLSLLISLITKQSVSLRHLEKDGATALMIITTDNQDHRYLLLRENPDKQLEIQILKLDIRRFPKKTPSFDLDTTVTIRRDTTYRYQLACNKQDTGIRFDGKGESICLDPNEYGDDFAKLLQKPSYSPSTNLLDFLKQCLREGFN